MLPLLVSFLVLVFTWFLVSKNRRLPPGPWGLPLIGYHPFLSDEPHRDFAALSKKYGPVLSYRSLGGRLIVVLNGLKVIKDVMVNRADEFLGRPHGTSLVTWISDGIGMTQEEGEAWREQRRFFLATAKNYGFGKLELEEKILHDEYRQMLEDLRRTDGQDTDVQFHVAYANNTVISHLLFSKKFPKDEFYKSMLGSFKDIVDLFVGKRHVLVGYALNILLMFSPEMTAAKRGKRMFQKLTNKIVKEHLKNFDPDHPKDYVDEFLLHRQNLLKTTGNEGTFTLERLEANALNLFLEGTESVSYTIANLLSELSKHQGAQKAIQAELDAEIGRERLPSWADRARLPRLEATILELFRVRSPFFVSTMYSNFKETTIEGYRIPARSVLVYNIGSLHYDPVTYPDPLKFDPGRFLDEGGKRIKREVPFPYGIGKRSCIGESLAQMEVFIVIGAILQNFTLRPGNKADTLRVIAREQ